MIGIPFGVPIFFVLKCCCIRFIVVYYVNHFTCYTFAKEKKQRGRCAKKPRGDFCCASFPSPTKNAKNYN